MLLEPTLARLRELRLAGMAEALEEQQGVPDLQGLSFEDRLGLLVDREVTLPVVVVVHGGQRVAAHPRSHRHGGFTTDPSHRPEAHEKYLEWTPSRIIRWAEKTGPHTGTVIRQIIETKAHPEQRYRASLGVIRLGDRYSRKRLEAACQRALAIGGVSYRSIQSILEHGLDRLPVEQQATLDLAQDYDNLRGSNSYSSYT
jgi:transposase